MSALSSALKMIGSVAALVLAAVLAAWLWFDATAVARHDTAGVVVPADAPVAAGQPGPALPAERARQLQERSEALTQEVAAVAATERKLEDFGSGVRGAMDNLAIAGDEAAADRVAAAKAAKEKKAAEKAAAERAAAEKAAADKAAAERAARERVYTPPPAPAPAPVPVVPPGMCWDDDEWEECDDDWDDDDWDD